MSYVNKLFVVTFIGLHSLGGMEPFGEGMQLPEEYFELQLDDNQVHEMLLSGNNQAQQPLPKIQKTNQPVSIDWVIQDAKNKLLVDQQGKLTPQQEALCKQCKELINEKERESFYLNLSFDQQVNLRIASLFLAYKKWIKYDTTAKIKTLLTTKTVDWLKNIFLTDQDNVLFFKDNPIKNNYDQFHRVFQENVNNLIEMEEYYTQRATNPIEIPVTITSTQLQSTFSLKAREDALLSKWSHTRNKPSVWNMFSIGGKIELVIAKYTRERSEGLSDLFDILKIHIKNFKEEVSKLESENKIQTLLTPYQYQTWELIQNKNEWKNLLAKASQIIPGSREDILEKWHFLKENNEKNMLWSKLTLEQRIYLFVDIGKENSNTLTGWPLSIIDEPLKKDFLLSVDQLENEGKLKSLLKKSDVITWKKLWCNKKLKKCKKSILNSQENVKSVAPWLTKKNKSSAIEHIPAPVAALISNIESKSPTQINNNNTTVNLFELDEESFDALLTQGAFDNDIKYILETD